MKVIDCGRII